VFSLDSLKNFLSRPNTRVRLVVSDNSVWSNSSSVLSELPDEFLDRVSVFLAPKDNDLRHFSVSDKRDCRIEIDNLTREAVVRFSDNKFSEEAFDAFNALVEKSIPLVRE
jgi:uncharacterized protein (DUF2384 family)